MNEMMKALVNEALQSEQAHEYSINADGNLEGYSHEVVIHGDSYIVKGSDCSRCDGGHVDCVYVERVTTYPSEALENLEIISSDEGN